MSWISLVPLRYASWDGRLMKNHISVLEKFIRIRIDKSAIDFLGWVPGDRVDVRVGADLHRGNIRLEKNDEGWRLNSPNCNTPEMVRSVSVRVARSTLQAHLENIPDRLLPTRIDIEFFENGLQFGVPWLQKIDQPELSEEAVPQVSEIVALELPNDPLEAIEEVIQEERAEPEPVPKLAKASVSKKRRGDFSDYEVKTRAVGNVPLPPPTIVPGGERY